MHHDSPGPHTQTFRMGSAGTGKAAPPPTFGQSGRVVGGGCQVQGATPVRPPPRAVRAVRRQKGGDRPARPADRGRAASHGRGAPTRRGRSSRRWRGGKVRRGGRIVPILACHARLGAAQACDGTMPNNSSTCHLPSMVRQECAYPHATSRPSPGPLRAWRSGRSPRWPPTSPRSKSKSSTLSRSSSASTPASAPTTPRGSWPRAASRPRPRRRRSAERPTSRAARWCR
jgi:hypothetical protein